MCVCFSKKKKKKKKTKLAFRFSLGSIHGSHCISYKPILLEKINLFCVCALVVVFMEAKNSDLCENTRTCLDPQLKLRLDCFYSNLK